MFSSPESVSVTHEPSPKRVDEEEEQHQNRHINCNDDAAVEEQSAALPSDSDSHAVVEQVEQSLGPPEDAPEYDDTTALEVATVTARAVDYEDRTGLLEENRRLRQMLEDAYVARGDAVVVVSRDFSTPQEAVDQPIVRQQALPVSGEDRAADSNVDTGQVPNSRDKEKSSQHRARNWIRNHPFTCSGILAVITAAAVVGIVLGVTQGKTSSTPASTPFPTSVTMTPLPTPVPTPVPTTTPSPTPAPTTPFPTPLPTPAPTIDPATINATAALVEEHAFGDLTNISSPQRQALDWLLNNSILHEYSNQTKLQRFALATLYYSTDGPRWSRSTAWLSDDPECSWYSDSIIYPCSDGELISTINLGDNGLMGTLPPELALLSRSLGSLILDSNILSGTIPSEIGRMNNLKYLWLDSNTLTGTIPSEIGSMKKLEYLYLYNNALTGTIPSEIGSMDYLKWLDLDNNSLSGTIPREIGRAASLVSLWLNNNTLTGTIPSEINELINLDSLYLYGNNFTPPFTCPSFIEHCYVSCYDDTSDCREL